MNDNRTVDERARGAATTDERARSLVTVDERSRTAGTIDERASGATVDERRASVRRLRTLLPDVLLERYEPISNLGHGGGQADVVECRERTSGESVVVKLYRHSGQLSREVLNKLYAATPAHVVQLIDHGDAHGELWEVQEYCPEGTLADLLDVRGGRLSGPELTTVLRELSDAVHHVQTELKITHRDLKPENVLVRTLDPLDLVLTDFGIAAEQMVTVQFQTKAGSIAWMAPEALSEQQVTGAVDWWGLGAILYRAIAGRPLLSGPDGLLQQEKVHQAMVVRGEYTTDAITDPRWRNLIDGLLSYETRHRWGHAEVCTWLAGENPEVVRTTPRGAASGAVAEPDFAFVLDGLPVRSGRELAGAVRERWDAAGDLMAGRIDPQLERWILARPGGQRVLDSVGMETTPGARLIRLQAALDPEGPLVFRRREIDEDNLSRAIEEASRWTHDATGAVAESHAWLSGLRDEQIMRAVAAVVDEDAGRLLGAVDARLQAWKEQFRVIRSGSPGSLRSELDEAEPSLIAVMFAAALDPGSARDRTARARKAIGAGEIGGHSWGTQVREAAGRAADDDLGTLLAAQVVLASITDSVEAEKQRVLAERAASERRAREADRSRRAGRRRHRNQTNRRATPGRFGARLVPALIYSFLLYGITVSHPASWIENLLRSGWPMLLVCLVPIVLSLVLDWILDNPAGPLRAFGTSVGFVLGTQPWIAAVTFAVVTDSFVPTPGEAWLMPWGIGAGWMLGGLAQYGLDRLRARHSQGWGEPGWAIRWFRNGVRLLLLLASAGALTSYFLSSCGGGCARLRFDVRMGAEPFSSWQLEQLQVVGTLGLVWLAAAACVVYFVAAALWRERQKLGAICLTASGALAAVAFLAHPASPVTMLAGMVVGWFT